jgi:antitoxin YefM
LANTLPQYHTKLTKSKGFKEFSLPYLEKVLKIFYFMHLYLEKKEAFMTTVTMQKFATQIDEVLGEVESNGEALLVEREQGNFMVMSERDYNSIMETLYLLSTPANAKHLQNGIKQANSGSYSVKSIDDLWK